MTEELIPKMYEHIRRKISRKFPKYDPVRIIDRLILRYPGGHNRAILLDFKISIIREFKRDGLKESVTELISVNPIIAEYWIQLIIFYRDDVQDRINSILSCDICINIALLDGNFVVQCITEKVITALHFGEINIAIDSIEHLITYRRVIGKIDEDYQLDFLKHPNAYLIPVDISDRYIEHVNNSRSHKRQR